MDEQSENHSDLFDGVETANDDRNRSLEPKSEWDYIRAAVLTKAIDEFSDEPVFEPKDRPRGVFSPTDREYLFGLKEYTHPQSEANREQSIRERIQNALLDFRLIWALVDPDEREKTLDEMDQEDLNQGIESIITFAYFALDKNLTELERRIERGVLAGANSPIDGQDQGQATNVDVSIDIDYDPDVQPLYRKLQEGKASQLTPEEIGVLVKAGKLEPEDLKALEQIDTHFPGVYAGDLSSLEE